MINKANEFKVRTIFSSFLTLLPILIGIGIWNKIPNSLLPNSSIATNIETPIYKILLVFGIPLLLLVLNFICLSITYKDNSKNSQSRKILNSLFYICPSISIISSIFFYNGVMGNSFNFTRISPFLLGLMFILVGNNLPKTKPNSTYGIKTYWASQNNDNWIKTHRFAGVVWVILGILLLFVPMLQLNYITPAIVIIIALCVGTPIIFSYSYHKKQVKNGTYIKDGVSVEKYSKKQKAMSLIVFLVVLVAILSIMFTGNIDIVLERDTLSINTSFYADIDIPYDNIEYVEYREYKNVGTRLNGFGSFKLSLGTFQNDEFDNYTCYAYNSTKSCIAIKTSDGDVVINLDSDEQTKKLYNELLEKID